MKIQINAWVDHNCCELKEFLNGLSDAKRTSILSLIKRVGDKGLPENEEQSRLIGDGLYQLMTHDGICVIWFYAGSNYIICTHAFFAESGDVDREIEKAKSIRNSYGEVEANVSFKAARSAIVFRRNV